VPKMDTNLNDRIIMQEHFDVGYGFRPKDRMVFYLNAWEFLMWWEIVAKNILAARDRRETEHCGIQSSSANRRFILEFPAEAAELRDNFILVRRTRPIVPAPTRTPLPERVPLYPDVHEGGSGFLED